MKEFAFITGGSRGIGYALLKNLFTRYTSLDLITCSRTIPTTIIKDFGDSERLHWIKGDLSTLSGQNQIINAVKEIVDDGWLRYIVHNAAVMAYPNPTMNLSQPEFTKSWQTNVNAPLLITQLLEPLMERYVNYNGNGNGNQPRILFISSGWAHKSEENVAAYCATKAALFALCSALQPELLKKNILVGSIRPGIVDTNMQVQLRSDNSNFSRKDFFLLAKETNTLRNPKDVANFIRSILVDSPSEEYINQFGKEFNIHEHIHDHNHSKK